MTKLHSISVAVSVDEFYPVHCLEKVNSKRYQPEKIVVTKSQLNKFNLVMKNFWNMQKEIKNISKKQNVELDY